MSIISMGGLRQHSHRSEEDARPSLMWVPRPDAPRRSNGAGHYSMSTGSCSLRVIKNRSEKQRVKDPTSIPINL